MSVSYRELAPGARLVVDLAYEEATKVIAKHIELQRFSASAAACDQLREALAAYYQSADAKQVKGPVNRSLLAKVRAVKGARRGPPRKAAGKNS